MRVPLSQLKICAILRSHIAKQIKTKREAVSMTMEELGQALGYTRSKQVVGNWEAGQGVPSIYALCLLSMFFDCSIGDFFPNSRELAKESGITLSRVTLNMLTFPAKEEEE